MCVHSSLLECCMNVVRAPVYTQYKMSMPVTFFLAQVNLSMHAT